VKSLVVERVFPTGTAILNTEDPYASWMAPRTKAKVGLFSLDPGNELFRTHVAGGGLGAVLDAHDTLCLYRATLRIPVVGVRQIPIAFDGKARFNVANALAAALAAFAAGIELDYIRGGLTTFHATPAEAPGRTNIHEFRDFKVMVDYCHNAHAMATVGPFLSALKRTRLIGVLNSPGDRREEDFEDLGRLAAPHFDHVILRDDEDLRGREPGEVSGFLKAALLRNGMKKESIEILRGEVEAVTHALSLAKRDDLVAIFADRIGAVTAQVEAARLAEQLAESGKPR
jgi:cyanophycin synthetase